MPVEKLQDIRLDPVLSAFPRPEAFDRSSYRTMLTLLALLAVRAFVDRIADAAVRIDDQCRAAFMFKGFIAALDCARLADFGDQIECDSTIWTHPSRAANRLR